MNVIKKVTVFVMGLVVIGVLSTIIGVVTQPKNVEKNVTFELLENNELGYNVYDTINGYAIFNDIEMVVNLVSVSVNNDYNKFGNVTIVRNLGGAIIISDYDTDTPELEINPNNTYLITAGDLIEGDVIVVTFDVEVEMSSFIKTLILLMPLILSASLIGYLALSERKGNEL